MKKFLDEIKFFKKKYSFEIKLLSEENFIIPEYKIDLMNKSKKILSSIENINSIIEVKKLQVIVQINLKNKKTCISEN